MGSKRSKKTQRKQGAANRGRKRRKTKVRRERRDRRAQEEIRRRAVMRVIEGWTQARVAEAFGVHPNTVYKWFRMYEADGFAGLERRKSPGRPRALSQREEEKLKKIIVGKNPLQLNFGTALWTTKIIKQVVLAKFSKLIHLTTVWRMLRRIGLSPQKPKKRAFTRDEAAILHWTKTAFPEIVRRAKRNNSVILFLDEATLREDCTVGTTWVERGQTPVIQAPGTRRRINVISAVSPDGRLWFRCFHGNLNSERFIDFLSALLREFRRPLELILDGHSAHKSAETMMFLHEHRDRVTPSLLPAYAPELNPDEHVWSHLKGLFRWAPMQEDEGFAQAVEACMEDMRNNRALVRSFFGHPEVEYIRKALNW